MTKDDNLFDIKCVKFDADDAQDLIGKNVFVSDALHNICRAVNCMDITNPCYYGKLQSAQNMPIAAAFKIDSDDRTFKYAYYDPYYELKCALKRGETIEFNFGGTDWEAITEPKFNSKSENYRIKQKAALKWQDLKIGDIIRNTSDGYYCMVTMIDVDKDTKTHVCLGNQWVYDEIICKCHRVNAAGEDIE